MLGRRDAARRFRCSAARTRRSRAAARCRSALRLAVAALALLPATMLMGATLPDRRGLAARRRARRGLARLVLRGEHGRRRARQRRRRVLSAARPRRLRRDLRRRRAESRRRRRRAARSRAAPARRSAVARDRVPPRAAARARHGRDLCRDGVVRHDGARGRSALDSASVVAARRHGLHVRADPRRVPVRPRRSAAPPAPRPANASSRAPRSRRAKSLLGVAMAGAAYALARSLPYWPIDVTLPTTARRRIAARLAARGVRRVARRAALGRELAARARGRRARRRGSRDARSAGCTPRTRPAPSSARSRRRSCSSSSLGSQRTQQLLIVAAPPRRSLLLANAVGRRARRFAAAARGRGARAGRARRARAAARARRLRPVPADARRRRERRLRRRRPDGVDRRHGGAERHPDLSQRRQDAGFDVPARHALAAHARAPDDARSRATAQRARDRPRSRHHGGRRQRRPRRRARRRRRARAARARSRRRVLRRAQLRRRREPQGRDSHRRRPAPARDDGANASTRSRPIRSTRGSRALPRSTRASSGSSARQRLNDGGVVTVFVQLYETTEDAVRSELATFLDVFPNAAVFANTVEGMGYDAVLVGRNERRADRSHALCKLVSSSATMRPSRRRCAPSASTRRSIS